LDCHVIEKQKGSQKLLCSYINERPEEWKNKAHQSATIRFVVVMVVVVVVDELVSKRLEQPTNL